MKHCRPMQMPEPDPVFVRASVEDHCNLACVYCPKQQGMENHVPDKLRGKRLTVEEYLINLSHLSQNGLRGVAFTGGEPTLNRDLPKLISGAAKIFDRVELTTNGRFILEMFPAISPHIDHLKVSLDAVEPNVVSYITKGTKFEVERALNAVRVGCAAGIRVSVNVVVMRSTLNQIDRIIELCRSVNREGSSGSVSVSLLDLYFSEECRSFWEKEFYSLHDLENKFTARYGKNIAQERFGCRFFWYDADGVYVRFKDSYGATYRAPKCHKCKNYCQEGVYGIKHSVEGWVTTCPSSDPTLGVYLSPGLSSEEVDRKLAPILKDLQIATPKLNSFGVMLEARSLSPVMATKPCSLEPDPICSDSHEKRYPDYRLERK